MFNPRILEAATANCTLLLANPPYEIFDQKLRDSYAAAGAPVTARTKAVEMLNRTLPHLPAGGVFGVVLPQGVLDDKESNAIRDFLDRECELTEIDVFSDKLFEKGEHEVAVLMGRRRAASTAVSEFLTYRRVRDKGMAAFKERLAFSSERLVPRALVRNSPERGLILPELPDVWEYLGSAHRRLRDVISVEKGREYWRKERLEAKGMISASPRDGWQEAVLRADDDYPIWGMPTSVWIEPSRKAYRRPGATPGTKQVILNYARGGRYQWRLKAVVDAVGIGASSRFLVFRPKPGGPTLRAIWAVLNSPVANAYAYSFASKRETLPKDWRLFPFPRLSASREASIVEASERYLSLVTPPPQKFLQMNRSANQKAIRSALLEMDSEVLRAYDLPPRLERQLLDSFKDAEPRKGVGCEFVHYYPEGLEACIPLHKLLSDEVASSTIGRFAARYRPVSPSIQKVLRDATGSDDQG
jgi:hypothetical protein